MSEPDVDVYTSSFNALLKLHSNFSRQLAQVQNIHDTLVNLIAVTELDIEELMRQEAQLSALSELATEPRVNIAITPPDVKPDIMSVETIESDDDDNRPVTSDFELLDFELATPEPLAPPSTSASDRQLIEQIEQNSESFGDPFDSLFGISSDPTEDSDHDSVCDLDSCYEYSDEELAEFGSPDIDDTHLVSNAVAMHIRGELMFADEPTIDAILVAVDNESELPSNLEPPAPSHHSQHLPAPPVPHHVANAQQTMPHYGLAMEHAATYIRKTPEPHMSDNAVTTAATTIATDTVATDVAASDAPATTDDETMNAATDDDTDVLVVASDDTSDATPGSKIDPDDATPAASTPVQVADDQDTSTEIPADIDEPTMPNLEPIFEAPTEDDTSDYDERPDREIIDSLFEEMDRMLEQSLSDTPIRTQSDNNDYNPLKHLLNRMRQKR